MEQYKVILVDDEAEVIDIMEAKIRWSELGFEAAAGCCPDRYQNALYGWS